MLLFGKERYIDRRNRIADLIQDRLSNEVARRIRNELIQKIFTVPLGNFKRRYCAAIRSLILMTDIGNCASVESLKNQIGQLMEGRKISMFHFRKKDENNKSNIEAEYQRLTDTVENGTVRIKELAKRAFEIGEGQPGFRKVSVEASILEKNISIQARQLALYERVINATNSAQSLRELAANQARLRITLPSAAELRKQGQMLTLSKSKLDAALAEADALTSVGLDSIGEAADEIVQSEDSLFQRELSLLHLLSKPVAVTEEPVSIKLDLTEPVRNRNN